jgi:hypothetical protein
VDCWCARRERLYHLGFHGAERRWIPPRDPCA